MSNSKVPEPIQIDFCSSCRFCVCDSEKKRYCYNSRCCTDNSCYTAFYGVYDRERKVWK